LAWPPISAKKTCFMEMRETILFSPFNCNYRFLNLCDLI
jgi:hypothetical protein